MPALRTSRWTAAEICVLREHYPTEGAESAARMPGRSWRSVQQKAFQLGIACHKVTSAPQSRLTGDELEEAIRLREECGWSFARIAAKFDVAEASACNAVLIALCPRKGFTPAERDANGRITEAGLERLRYALKKGLKGVDIQLRLGVSASCVAEQRRRYERELKANGKASLPPPGGGESYSGVKLTRAQKASVEHLFLQGLGTLKVSERTGVSKTSCTRIRNRLIKRLRRKGENLRGCDVRGVRHEQADSSRFIPEELKDALRAMLLDRVPVRRAALMLAIGGSSAYRIRNELAAELEAQGKELPGPILPGRARAYTPEPTWPPQGAQQIYAFRDLLRTLPFDEAKAEWRRRRREERQAERARPRSFEEQLQRVAKGVPLAPTFAREHMVPRLAPEAVPA